MPASFWINAAIALVPGVLFLIALGQMDAFEIVSAQRLLSVTAVGGAMAIACYFINGRTLDGLPIGFTDYSFYISPVIEEVMKGGFMLWLIYRNRVGFVLDSVVLGFALGLGFALFENVYYLYLVPQANFGVWLVRGLGTAVMHGGATAAFAAITQGLLQRFPRLGLVAFLPGLLAAILLHGAFNHFPNQPVLAMVIAVAGIPLMLLFTLSKSEHTTDRWLHADHDAQLAIVAGASTTATTQRMLGVLGERLPADLLPVVSEYLRLHALLVLTADDLLLAHEQGEALDQTVDPAPLERLHALERRLGRSTLMALRPYMRFSRRELWEIHHLESLAKHSRKRVARPVIGAV